MPWPAATYALVDSIVGPLLFFTIDEVVSYSHHSTIIVEVSLNNEFLPITDATGIDSEVPAIYMNKS